ncbi:MAG: pyruvate formate lyase family protein [Polyangia bacterium]|jgi:formate C-acetyltransferase|nr:pyruvate formate lyase family protein [Polyangia bacterium]
MVAVAASSELEGLPSGDIADAERIRRIQRRYQTGSAWISIQRARAYTEGYEAATGRGLALPVCVALAVRRVFETMTCLVDADDHIAGHWTEHFLGVPIDIERGVFNRVFEIELTRPRLAVARVRALGRAFAFMARRRALGRFVRNARRMRKSGAAPLDLSLATMGMRAINAWQIRPEDRDELLGDLLPRWRGRTLVDRLERELERSGLYSHDMHAFAAATHGNTSRQVAMLSTCATIAAIQGHLILDHRRLLAEGLDGLRADVAARLQDETCDREARDFLQSVAIALDGVTVFASRLADAVQAALDDEPDAGRRAALERMLRTCRRVPFRPAETFVEAIQALWTVKTAVEVALPINLQCLGRIDQILGPYYERDLAAGRITPEAARSLLAELLLKLMAQNVRPESGMLSHFYHRFLGSAPVTVGGMRPDGTDGTNAVTELVLEAAVLARAVTNVSVRVHRGTPDALLLRIAELLRRGVSCFSLFSDETHVPAMQARGFSQADARDYAIMGCVEATCPGKTGHMSASALLLSRLLDMTLRNGDVAMMAGLVRGDGKRTGDPDRFATFDDLLEAFFVQAEASIGKIVAGSNLRDALYASRLPAPVVSAFMEGCLESRRDVTRGGAVYEMAGISMINSVANLVDGLRVIDELVFRQRRFTVGQIIAAIDDDFEGHPEVRRAIDAVAGKWGNGDPDTDALASRVVRRLVNLTHPHRTVHGGPFVVYMISMITHTIDGRLSVATPDGRRAATPFAASGNPYNVERAGPTAVLRSVAALPFDDLMGAAINMKFHPTAIGDTLATRKKWVALLRTYFGLGGGQLQPTCVSAETLRDARAHPDRHRDLIVKVGGYSTYFVDLGREIQQEIIQRTEHR